MKDSCLPLRERNNRHLLERGWVKSLNNLFKCCIGFLWIRICYDEIAIKEEEILKRKRALEATFEANVSLSLKYVTKLHKLLDDAQKYINVGKYYEKCLKAEDDEAIRINSFYEKQEAEKYNIRTI